MANIDGTLGDDTILVDANAGQLNGTPVANTPPTDNVRGGAGNDTIIVTDSNVLRVRGEDDDDEITVTNSTVRRAVTGDDGNDTLSITGSIVDRNVLGGNGDDEIIAENSTLRQDVNAGPGDSFVFLRNSSVAGDVIGGADQDIFRFENTSVAGTVSGGTGADNLLQFPPGTQITVRDPNDPSVILQNYTITDPGQTDILVDGLGEALLPTGQTITFEDFVATNRFTPICLAAGTKLETIEGEREIESLSVGDLLRVSSGSFEPIRWIGRATFHAASLSADPRIRPVRIKAGALGQGLPHRDLLVSRQHRLLVQSKIAARMFGESEVLVSAIKLTDLPGIYVEEEIDCVEYFHILFDRHEIIYAEGAPTESLFTGPEALKSIPPESRAELFTIFPELTELQHCAVPARVIPGGKMQKRLVSRHLKNERPLLGPR